MNPIFSEVVRRTLRRRREAQAGSKAKIREPFPPESSLPSRFKNSSPRLSYLSLLWFGLIGALVTVLFLSTSLLAMLLRMMGLDWLTSYLAYGLFPILFVFIGIAAYAWARNRA